MRRAVLVWAATWAVAACGSHPPVAPTGPTPVTPTSGALTILAREHDSGEPLAHADLKLQQRGAAARAESSSATGFTTFDHLPPGIYDLVATYGGQPVTVLAIDIHANQISYVDVEFTRGDATPVTVQFADTTSVPVEHYHPAGANPTVGRIEGTVSDTRAHGRVSGAVVSVIDSVHPNVDVLQTVTDEQGRYHFDDVRPGTYAVSAVYSMGGRGEIEVRHSGLEVTGGDAAIVRLWIELAN